MLHRKGWTKRQPYRPVSLHADLICFTSVLPICRGSILSVCKRLRDGRARPVFHDSCLFSLQVAETKIAWYSANALRSSVPMATKVANTWGRIAAFSVVASEVRHVHWKAVPSSPFQLWSSLKLFKGWRWQCYEMMKLASSIRSKKIKKENFKE